MAEKINRMVVKKSTPSPVCFKTGMDFKQCKFLVVGGDPDNPVFSCNEPTAKLEERNSDCDHGVYVLPQDN